MSLSEISGPKVTVSVQLPILFIHLKKEEKYVTH